MLLRQSAVAFRRISQSLREDCPRAVRTGNLNNLTCSWYGGVDDFLRILLQFFGLRPLGRESRLFWSPRRSTVVGRRGLPCTIIRDPLSTFGSHLVNPRLKEQQ